jgi:chromosome segregation ATPase
MEQGILDSAMQQGLWALLFVSLYLWQLKEARRTQDEARGREDKLMTFIDDISEQFAALAKQYERISEDVREIKDGMRKKGE